MTTEKRRVLVVEDSLTVRKRLVEVLNADPELRVIAEAEDGRSAVELCKSLRPDVVTLDMMLPIMTGLAATEQIMAYCPTPILIVSSSLNRGEVFTTYDALSAGAVDVLDKPPGDDGDEAWARRLTATVKLVSRIKVITHPRARLDTGKAPSSPLPSLAPPRQPKPRRLCRAVALGASTGGPGAIVEVLRGLPPDFPIPIVIVLHLGKPFAESFAEWLDGQSPLPVKYAEDGELVPAMGSCKVLLAPPDSHLTIANGKLRLVDEAPRHSCRPSVDVLFESVARELGDEATGCLLTGMGRDGAAGLLAIRQAGGLTLAQDEATSVVFGMPQSAIALGAVDEVLPLNRFAPVLLGLCPRAPERRRQ